MTNYYEVLGVSKTATPEAIKRAYKNLSLQWHPDKNANSEVSQKKFQEISEAYAVLSNQLTRTQTDKLKAMSNELKNTRDNNRFLVKALEKYKKVEDKPFLKKGKLFTCSSCAQEKNVIELANTVPVYNSDPIKTCRECYNFYHNPPKEKKVERQFFCSFCRAEVISIRYRMRVDVSEPNELDLKKGETYDFCSTCKSKVKEYNEAEDEDNSDLGPWS